MAQQPKGTGRQLVVYQPPGTPGAHQPQPNTKPKNAGAGTPAPASPTIQLKSMDWRWLAGAAALVLGLMLSLRSVTTSLPTTWWLWALVLAGLAIGLYFAHKKNDIGASIIKYSLMGLGALMLATWLGLGNVAKVGQNIGDTLAGNNPPRTVTRTALAAVAPSRPEGAPLSVNVPRCTANSQSWSDPIPVMAYWNFTTNWDRETLVPRYLVKGEWTDTLGPDGRASQAKYCTRLANLAGQQMFLTWRSEN